MTDIQSLLEKTDRLCAAGPGKNLIAVRMDDSNAMWLAHAGTALPQLAAEVRRLQSQLDSIEQATQRAAIEAWGHSVDFATARDMAENDEP